MRPPGRRIWALLGALALGGCYTYVPVERPSVGTPVRVKVPVRSSVGASTSDTEMVTFEGTVISFGDTLSLGTRTNQTVGVHGERVLTDTIRVRTNELEGLETRVLSKGRTAAFAAAVVGGSIAIAAAISGLAGSDGGGKPDGPDPQPFVAPDGVRSGWRLFGIRIPIPWPSG